MMGTKGKIISFVLLLALMATPLAGCVVNRAPNADFLYSPFAPTTADTILFTDNSTDDGNIVSWAWDFGDGNTSSLQNPSHLFTSPGIYTVSLTVTDDDGASDISNANITVSSPPQIDKWDAIEILVGEIIPPASSYERISAFMLSEPLRAGDVVTSESGEDYPIDASTWFIFIDDQPQAFYAHNTRYVFIDARTADYDIVNESWPPEINNFSMWDTQSLDRGHLIEVWSILDSALPISGSISDAPSGDYGDAPDGQDAYYGVLGSFPTLFHTTNSQFGRPGGHALNVGEETLGLNVSAEVDAIDLNDPDGVPNLVDADSDERMYAIMEGTKARLAFTVTVSPNAPDVTRYANALIDFDQSGNWSTGTYGLEWVVVNLEVDVDPGSSETIITPEFSWGNQLVPPSPVWMRVALTRDEVDEALFANIGGWEGSGQFSYGEIEDHFAFLMEKPPLPDFVRWPPAPKLPPGGDGKPPPGGGGQPPGPPEGDCGYDINYYVIIISGGDCADDIAQGTPIVQESVDRMAGLTSEQGYQSVGNLGPGNNSLGDIGNAFDQLAANVKCGDHVLIYICGHGKKDGGIALKDAGGKTQEVLGTEDGDNKDNSLEDFLNKIPPCKPDEDCETPRTCCHVTVIIESCYAGNFNVPGVTGQGRTVIGTSTNTPSWATSGGGVYTQGFDKDSRDSASDTNQDGYVDPMEANKTAEDAVDKNNSKQGKSQTPWSNSQECPCKCPCKPGINVEKWIWYEPLGIWMDEMAALPGQLVTFRLEIESSGKCRGIVDLEVTDLLPGFFGPGSDPFEGQATLYYDGQAYARPPDAMSQIEGGLQLTWNLEEIGPLAPGDSIAIEYAAYAEYPGENTNILFGSAHCAVDYSVVVTDRDSATVMVQEEELPPVETVLYGYLKITVQCTCVGPVCQSCMSNITLKVTDLTQGSYPVTYVALYVNGELFNSWEMSTTYFEQTIPMPVGCGQEIEIELVAMNLVGLEVTVSGTIDTLTNPCGEME